MPGAGRFAVAIAVTLGLAVAEWAPAWATEDQGGELVQRRIQRQPLRPGDPAPDFNLKVLGGDQRIRLSSFSGHKPVVLVFGSYT